MEMVFHSTRIARLSCCSLSKMVGLRVLTKMLFGNWFGMPLRARALIPPGWRRFPLSLTHVPESSNPGNRSLPLPRQLDAAILCIPGVVGTGLFVEMADAVIVQDGEDIEVRERPR